MGKMTKPAVFTHIVTRAFEAEGVELFVNDPVNAATWKNTDRLVAAGYLRQANAQDYAARLPRPPEARVDPPVNAKQKKFLLKKR